MKRSVFVCVLCFSLSANATLVLKEVRTASNQVLVAYFKSDVVRIDEVDTNDVALWTLNGQPVAALNKFVTEADACDHHLYMKVPTLVQGKTYTLKTPHGDSTFVFDDHKIFCESIKTNQNVYSALSRVRYANFAIWLGDGGSRQIQGDLPLYTVFKMFTGEQVAHGKLMEIGQDESSGDFVYRIDLSAVPEGGPYIIAKNRPTDPAVKAQFTAAIKGAADREIGYLKAHAYPVGTPMNLSWWGSNVAQGQYAYPCLLYWALTGEQAYMDAASQLMDYSQGLNPIGKCYMCGTGFNRVHNPHDRESAYTKEQGWGPRPGILVFGPGQRPWNGQFPQIPLVTGLARERLYVDHLPTIQWNEFTIYQSLCFPAAVYPVLSQGGKWDEAKGSPYEQ